MRWLMPSMSILTTTGSPFLSLSLSLSADDLSSAFLSLDLSFSFD